MEETIRAFIAIELGRRAQEEISAVQERLVKAGADVKWVEPADIHLTLRFLGDITPDNAGIIGKILSATAARFKPFDISIKGIGAFPDASSPKVVWAGIGTGAHESSLIAADIERELRAIGIPGEDREFRPHITIGRVRSRKNIDALCRSIGEPASAEGSTVKAGDLILFQSRLAPRGPVYTPLFRAKMAIS